MRDEQAQTADVADDILEDGLGDGDAVVGGGAAAELVEDDERAGTSALEDVGRLGQLDGEGGLVGEEGVVGTHAGVNAVEEAEARGGGGHV